VQLACGELLCRCMCGAQPGTQHAAGGVRGSSCSRLPAAWHVNKESVCASQNTCVSFVVIAVRGMCVLEIMSHHSTLCQTVRKVLAGWEGAGCAAGLASMCFPEALLACCI
jgi:hypothetical protein